MAWLGFDRPPTVLLAVIASTFFVGFGGGVVFPILPNLGAVLGISAFMVGVILSATRWVRLVANAPAGALVDRYGTRKPFVYGLFIEGIATLGYVVALMMPRPTRSGGSPRRCRRSRSAPSPSGRSGG